MVMCDTGLSGIALLIGSVNTRPTHLGSGSGATLTTATGLVAHTDRNAFTSTDLSIYKKVSYTTFFSSLELSGLTLREYGPFSISSGGTVWSRQGIQPITFDGTQEADIEIVWELS